MAAGGFDAVIGNPPYLAGREWEAELHEQRSYFRSHYSCFTDQYDLYALFIQQSVELVRTSGYYGVITPNTWLNSEHYLSLREWLTQSASISSLSDYRNVRVFKDATVLPIIFVARKEIAADENKTIEIRSFHKETEFAEHRSSVAIWRQFPNVVFNLLLTAEDIPAIRKIESKSMPLGSLAAVRFGVKVYQKGKGRPKQAGYEAAEKKFEASRKLSAEYLPYLWGGHVTPWKVQRAGTWLKYGEHLAEPRTIDLFTGSRVLVRRIVGTRLVLAPVSETLVADQLLHTVKPHGDETNANFLAAILQSWVVAYYFRKRFNRTEKTFPEIRVAELAALPIRVIDPKKKSDRAQHDALVVHVERMLKLHADLAAAKSPDAQTHLARDIAATDRAIDQLVYQLYGLTAEEIALVESTTAPMAKAAAEPAEVPAPKPAVYTAQAEADAAHIYFVKEDSPKET